MLYSFGRADQLDRAGIERLIGALSRLLGKDGGAQTVAGVPGLEYVESRPLGGTWLLDQLWHRLRIDTSMTAVAGRHPPSRGDRAGAVLPGREPGAGTELEAGRRRLGDATTCTCPGLPEVSEDACYRAMDWLLQVEPTLARNVYD